LRRIAPRKRDDQCFSGILPRQFIHRLAQVGWQLLIIEDKGYGQTRAQDTVQAQIIAGKYRIENSRHLNSPQVSTVRNGL
jgi:hypothetical protein